MKPAPEVLSEFLDKNKISLKVIPQYKPRDDGTFSTVISVIVDYIPEEDAKDD